MNDPHVEYLIYRLRTTEGLNFKDPAPLDRQTDTMSFWLEDEVLTVWPREAFSSEEEAREAVDPYLRSWEAHEAIRHSGKKVIIFDFETSKALDQDPPPPGATQVIRPRSTQVGIEVWSPTVVQWDPHYPEPPESFVASDVVEFMLERYRQYRAGREPLLTMAYVCLTRVQFDCRNTPHKGQLRHKVAREYAVDYDVLAKLGHLTTVLGDEAGARKVGAQGGNRAPTDKERRWIERCVLALIRRTGEYAADPQTPIPQITMSDLPKL